MIIWILNKLFDNWKKRRRINPPPNAELNKDPVGFVYTYVYMCVYANIMLGIWIECRGGLGDVGGPSGAREHPCRRWSRRPFTIGPWSPAHLYRHEFLMRLLFWRSSLTLLSAMDSVSSLQTGCTVRLLLLCFCCCGCVFVAVVVFLFDALSNSAAWRRPGQCRIELIGIELKWI